MGAGWRLIDSNGEVYKSWHSAVEAYSADPSLTFESSELWMSGEERRDVTNEVHRRSLKEPTDDS